MKKLPPFFIKPGYTDTEKDKNLGDFFNELIRRENKSALDNLNLFLLQLGNADRICYRKKIVMIKKFLKSIGCEFIK